MWKLYLGWKCNYNYISIQTKAFLNEKFIHISLFTGVRSKRVPEATNQRFEGILNQLGSVLIYRADRIASQFLKRILYRAASPHEQQQQQLFGQLE